MKEKNSVLFHYIYLLPLGLELLWFIQKSLFSLSFGEPIFSCLKAVTAVKISLYYDLNVIEDLFFSAVWISEQCKFCGEQRRNKSFKTRYMLQSLWENSVFWIVFDWVYSIFSFSKNVFSLAAKF